MAVGEESYIYCLYIDLNVGLEQDRTLALVAFEKLVIKTFKALEIPLPSELPQSIVLFKNFTADFDSYNVEFECKEFNKAAWSTLSIISKLHENSNQTLQYLTVKEN